MDRRQQKTRAAIFQAFSGLLAEKSYSRITVQEIIDRANIGRTTFYAHFETKDDLLKELCEELFGHILASAKDCTHTHGLYSDASAPQSVFCHLLQHLQQNHHNILGLLSSENNDIFLRYFKDGLKELIQARFVAEQRQDQGEVPQDFLVNHIAGSFVELVLWWVQGRMKQTPAELDHYFWVVIGPVLGH